MAREAPAAPPSSPASCSIISYLPASPRPRPPETTTAASSSLGPVDCSAWLPITRAAPLAPQSAAGRSTSCAGAPPTGSAWNDLGRMRKICGPPEAKRVCTLVVPPKMGSMPTRAPPVTASSVTLVMTGVSSRTESRPATSRPS